jgi:hypothetical protein
MDANQEKRGQIKYPASFSQEELSRNPKLAQFLYFNFRAAQKMGSPPDSIQQFVADVFTAVHDNGWCVAICNKVGVGIEVAKWFAIATVCTIGATREPLVLTFNILEEACKTDSDSFLDRCQQASVLIFLFPDVAVKEVPWVSSRVFEILQQKKFCVFFAHVDTSKLALAFGSLVGSLITERSQEVIIGDVV